MENQIAVLVVFPPEYTMEDIRRLMQNMPTTATVTTKEFNPEHGGVCIYQP